MRDYLMNRPLGTRRSALLVSYVFSCALFGMTVTLAAPAKALLQVADQTLPSVEFDILFRGGQVMDGTGTEAFRADVGIFEGRIAAIGDLSAASGVRIIDLGPDSYVLPGFIDIHSHADQGLTAPGGPGTDGAMRRAAPNLVSQGITTVVVNQDGGSPESGIAQQRAALESLGHGPNAALMVGHNTIRQLVLGHDFMRLATADEVAAMTLMVEQAMAEGAYGLSAGLEYIPGIWSDTEELIPLVEAAGRGGGIYIVHERSSGNTPMWWWPSEHPQDPPTMIETILEDISVAERTGVTTVATHIKARGDDFWGAGEQIAELIEEARARGVPIWADQYPYNTTGSDGNTVLLPRWIASSDGADWAESLRRALESRGENVRADILHEISRRGGAANLVIMDHPDDTVVGKTLAELVQLWDVDPVDAAIRLQLEGDPSRPGGARVRGFSLSEIDVETFSGYPWLVTASDAGIALTGDGPVHARFYGTFPRKIRRYAIERGVLTVEEAVRSSTTLPAELLGIDDRGTIQEGFIADVTVVDMASLQDHATFFEPHQYASGVDYVLVNGEFVVDGGELTWALPGTVLTPR